MRLETARQKTHKSGARDKIRALLKRELPKWHVSCWDFQCHLTRESKVCKDDTGSVLASTCDGTDGVSEEPSRVLCRRTRLVHVLRRERCGERTQAGLLEPLAEQSPSSKRCMQQLRVKNHQKSPHSARRQGRNPGCRRGRGRKGHE